MSTDWNTVFKDMLAAAQGVAKNDWPKMKEEAEEQFKVLAEVGARIAARKALNTISETNARFLLAQYDMAAQNVLFSVEGMTNLIVEKAYNAARAVLAAAVKAATGGWVLL